MGELIPSVSIAEFKKFKASEIRELKAVEVTSDGMYLFTAIIPHGDFVAIDFVKTQAEYLAVKANITGGREPDEVRGEIHAFV